VSIGDTVNFELSGTIPSHATDYDYYFFILNDTLSTGLTFDASSVKVYKDSVAEGNLLTADTDYKLYTGDDADGKTFQVALTDAISLAGKKIIVTYSATLNENAVIGETGNDNTFTITYSNNPNHNYDGDKKESTPGKPDSTSHSPVGETVEKKTQTYTTGIEIRKVDQDGKVLTGAEFTITGDSAEIVLVSAESFEEAADGEYYALKNGTYTKDAPQEKDIMHEQVGPATADSKGYVVDPSYDGSDKQVIGGKTYRPVTADDVGATYYILVKANADEYTDTSKKYKKTVTYTAKDTNTTGVTATAEVGPDGVVTFKGLGAGSYTISESKTPAGYNTIADLTVDITFTANPTGENAVHWSKTSGDATYNKETGVFEITIENNKGNTLPSTGGIGTTLFYIGGSILVLAAIILLVTRRRMGAND